MIAQSYVPPEELRERRALVRGRKRLVEKRTDFKNEVHALPDVSPDDGFTGRYSNVRRFEDILFGHLYECSFDRFRCLIRSASTGATRESGRDDEASSSGRTEKRSTSHRASSGCVETARGEQCAGQSGYRIRS